MTNNALVTIYSMKDGTQITSKLYEESVVETEIFAGKNQPYSGVIVKLVKNTFSDAVDGGIWNDTNKRPTIVNGETKIDVATFGTINKYIIANVSTDSSYTTIVAYHPAYRLAYTRLSEVFNKMFKVKFVDVYDFPNIPTTDEYKVQPKWGIFSTGLHDFTSKHSSIKDSNNISRTVSIGDAVIPSDAYRASKNKGAQKIYTGGIGSNLNIFDSEYKTDPLFDISKYTSGIGYEGETGTIDSDNPALNKFTFWHRKDGINLIFHINVVDVSKYNESGVLIEPQKYTSEIEWVEGRSEDIIRFLLKYAMDDVPTLQYFTTPSMFYPDPITYESDSTADISDSYTNEALQAAVQRGPIIIDPYDRINALPNLGTPIGVGINTERIRLRVGVDVPCGSIIQNLATLTNRYFFFCDEGFFLVGTEEVAISTSGDVTTKDKRKVTVYTEHSPSASFLTPRAGVLLDMDPAYSESILGNIVTPEELIMTPNLQDNGDGNVIGSQTVEGDGYSVKIYNSSSESSNAGVNILLPVADMGEGNNAYRNRILEICAYNALVKNYKFEDNITYNVSELLPYIANYNTKALGDEPNKKYFTNLSDLNSYKGTVVPGNNDIAMVDSGIIEQAYKYEGGEWNPIDSSNPALTINTMVPVIPLHTVAKELRDNFNGVILHNAPLNLITRSYPYFDTTLQWGNSATCDLVAQTKELKVSSVTNSNSGSEDAKISNKFASKLVVGNLTLDELTKNNDEKSGYTGLIMEKHVGSDLYRLSGYNKGAVQAEFDTKGRISAGAGSIILDEHGLTMGEGDSSITVGHGGFHAGPVTLDNTGVYVKDLDDPTKKLVWMNQDGFTAGDVFMDNTGVFVSKKVFMNKNGFSTQDNGLIVNGEGMHVGGEVTYDEGGATAFIGGHIKLGLKGIEIGEPFDEDDESKVEVLIDNTGIKVGPYTNTNNVPLGTVYMDRDGVYVRDITGASPYDKVRMNSSGFHVGKSGSTVTMDENGVHAGAVLMDFKGMRIKDSADVDYIDINQNGFFVGPYAPVKGVVEGGKVSMTSAGIKAGDGSVWLHDTGLTVGDAANRVTLTEEGVKAGNGSVHLHNLGLTVGSGNNLVTMTSAGVKAGTTLLNSNGFYVLKNTTDGVTVANTHVSMGSGGVKAGPVTLSSNGIDVDGKVSMGVGGVKAGTTLLNSNGFYVLKNTINGVTVANTHVSMGSGGVKAGPVTINDSGLQVGKTEGATTTYKTVMNENGFIVGPYGGTNVLKAKSETGIVVMNELGMNIRDSNKDVAIQINENGFIVGPTSVTTGQVVVDKLGVHAGAVDLTATGVTLSKMIFNPNTNEDEYTPYITMSADGFQANAVQVDSEGVKVAGILRLSAEESYLGGDAGVVNEGDLIPGFGRVKVTNRGLEVDNKILINSSGIMVGPKLDGNKVDTTQAQVHLDEHGIYIATKTVTLAQNVITNPLVILNRQGLTVSPVNMEGTSGKVTMKEEGVRAGFTLLDAKGFHVQKSVYVPAVGLTPAVESVDHVLMDKDGVHAGNTLLDENGFHVLKNAALAPTAGNTHITMKSTGVHAGSVTLNSDGIDVDGKVSMGTGGVKAGTTLLNSNGFYVLKNTTDGVTVANTHVSMGTGGVKAGNTVLDSNGFHVIADASKAPTVAGNTLVTMKSTGVHAGSVTLNNNGLQVADGTTLKTLMNQYGFIAGPTGGLPTATTGKVLMDENGLSAGSGDDRVTINENGIRLGNYNKSIDEKIEESTPNPGPHIIINNTGMSVYKDNIYKTVMNGAGFIAGPNGGLPTSQYGDVVLNQHGLIVGPGSEYNAKNGRGDVTLKNDGLTLYSGASDGDYIEERAVKFRELGSSSIDKDLARIYITQHNINSNTHHTLNISTYNKKDEFGLGSIKIGNVDANTKSDQISTGWASGFTEAFPDGFKTVVGNLNKTFPIKPYGEEIICGMAHLNVGSGEPISPDWASVHYMQFQIKTNDRVRVQIILDGKSFGEPIFSPNEYTTIKIDLIKNSFFEFQLKSVWELGSTPVYIYIKNMKFVLSLDQGGSIEVNNYRTGIDGKLELYGLLHGNFNTSKAARTSLGMDEKSGFSDSVTLTSASANTVYRTGEKSEVVSVIRDAIYLYIATCSDINKSNRKIIYTMQDHTNANGWTTAIGVIPPHTYYYFGDNDADHKYYIRSCTRDL